LIYFFSVKIPISAIFTALVVAGIFGKSISLISITVAGLIFAARNYLHYEESPPYFYFNFRNMDLTNASHFCRFLLFLFMLPMLNALADVLSVTFTRWSLRRIVAGRLSAAWVVVGVLVDVVFAMGCLALLLWSITWALDLWAAYGPIPLAFDWKAYRTTLCGGDWQAGTMLWLMLITTLLPTALHLAMGFAAVFAHTRQVDAEIVAHLGPALAQWQNATSETEKKRAVDLVLSSETRIQYLTGLLCRKDSHLRWVTAALFALFLALMIGAVLSLAHYMALPQLCPVPSEAHPEAPDDTTHDLILTCAPFPPITTRHGPVAQWSEQGAHNALVGGSSPSGPTTHALAARPSRAWS
jgi:hypothetical protein